MRYIGKVSCWYIGLGAVFQLKSRRGVSALPRWLLLAEMTFAVFFVKSPTPCYVAVAFSNQYWKLELGLPPKIKLVNGLNTMIKSWKLYRGLYISVAMYPCMSVILQSGEDRYNTGWLCVFSVDPPQKHWAPRAKRRDLGLGGREPAVHHSYYCSTTELHCSQ